MDGTQISLSEPSQNQQPGGPGNQGEPNGNSPGEGTGDNFGNFLGLSNILFLFGMFIL